MATSTEELKTLNRRRGHIQGAMTIFSKKLDAYEASDHAARDPFDLQAALDGLRSRYAKFSDIQDAIECLDETETERRSTFEQYFDQLIGRAMRCLSTNVAPSNITSTHSTCPVPSAAATVRLPQLEIPKFDGSIENWNEFYDLFSSLIDKNDSLSPVQKLQYLRSAVTGKAANAIDALPATEKNYGTSIEILKKKFDCVHRIVRRHWELMQNYPPLQKDTPAALGDLVDLVTLHVRALKNLGQLVETWDVPLIALILSKVSSDTAWNWELTFPDSKLPSYTHLLEFLEKRANCSNSLASRIPSKNRPQQESSRQKRHGTSSARQTFVTMSASPCSICSETTHSIMKCPKFHAMSLTERQNAVRAATLCYNCLKPNHQVAQCTSRNCSMCKKRHNTLLHKAEVQEQIAKPTPSNSQA